MHDKRGDSEEIRRFLLVAELLKHTLTPSSTPTRSRPRWQVILESSGGAALITVFIGGIVAATVGQHLTHRYQQSLRQREIATATYQAYLKRSDNTIARSFVLVGAVVSASDDLQQFAQPAWNPKRFPASAQGQLVAQHAKVIADYRSAAIAWKNEREQLALLLQYYHNANPEVVTAWRDLQKSVSAYSACSWRLYLARETLDTSPIWRAGCIGERHVLSANLDRFISARLEAARREAKLSAQPN